MKLFSVLVSILAVVSSYSNGRMIVGNNTRTWSPKTIDPCAETVSHLEDFIHVHEPEIKNLCISLPDEYKGKCEKLVTFPYPPEVICEALKKLEPADKTYWIAFFR